MAQFDLDEFNRKLNAGEAPWVTNDAEMDAILLKIAQQKMSPDIATLETCGSDSADFHTVGIWDIKAALRAAFEAGQNDGLAQAEGEK